MRVPEGYSEVPEGRLAAVVTYLEMWERPQHPPSPAPAGMRIRAVPSPDPDWYRRLYLEVGAPWLWFGRLRMNDRELTAVLQDSAIEVFALESGGADKGLLELDLRAFPDLELLYFGVTPDLIGRGAGRYLIDFAIERAWSHAPRRFHVHTCTLDHPRALEFYVKAGFTPYARGIEVSPDPRLSGELPPTAAPQVPIIRPR